MSYTLKTQQIAVKDPDTGVYSGVDVLTEQTKSGLLAEIQAKGDAVKAEVDAHVEGYQDDIDTITSEAQTAVNTLESQKNTIAQTIASMAQLGTDTTLTTPGMAADAATCGDLKNALDSTKLMSFDARKFVNGVPKSGGGWQLTASSAYQHVAIPVNGGEKLHILTNASNAGGSMAVVKSYSGTGSGPDYCDNEPFDTLITILANKSLDYILPSEARYVIYCVKWNNNSLLPRQFILNGYDYVKSAEQNIADIDTAIKNLNGVNNWYVNASTGSDDNDGLSTSTPFKTIQKAINVAGPLKESSPTTNPDACFSKINVASGTYDPFVVDGKNIEIALTGGTGTLTISASAGIAILLKNGSNVVFTCPVAISQSGVYNAISLRTNSVARFLNTLTITNTSTAITVMLVADCMLFVNGVLSITATSATGQCIYAQHSSRVVIYANNSTIDCGGTAVYAQTGSIVAIYSNPLIIDAHASTGLQTDSGIIIYRTVTNNATTKEKIGYGGRIFTGIQTDVNSKDIVTTGTDLNTVTKPGMYRLNGTYTNAPDIEDTYYGESTTNAVMLVINANSSGASANTVQIIIFGAPFAMYHRLFTGGSWYRWNSCGGNTFSYLKTCDLNDVKDQGMYILDPTTSAHYQYTNYPFGGDTKSVLYILRGMSDSHAVTQILYPMGHAVMPLYRTNVNSGDTWIPFGKNDDTSLFVKGYTHGNFDPITHNPQTVIKLKIGTINIGHFNYGSSSYYGFRTAEYDAKLHNWRKYLCRQQFDILNINEFVPYIDYLASADWDDGTKLTKTYLLKPQFMYFDSTMENDHKAAVIASKYPISNETEYSLAGTINNGSCKYYNVTIDENHVIGVYGVQLVFLANGSYNTAEAIANRAAQLSSLASVISAHNDNYVVVMGDFNTGTDDDLTNVLSFCDDNNLTPANGGFLDWMRTHEGFATAMSLDNILVSENILINDFDTHSDWYGALSTDHYGIGAEITLT